jgi:hypothetical protein
MKTQIVVCLSIFILAAFIPTHCQSQDWDKLVVLQSNRDEVEKILGKPEKYFETYGVYRTEIGRFSVWYSKGGCHKDVDGLQWNVSARKLTGILFSPERFLPLSSYITDLRDFKKQDVSDRVPRYLYVSPDEAIIYKTFLFSDSKEVVSRIQHFPGKSKEHLLCKEMK